jgi:hypothetical protein
MKLSYRFEDALTTAKLGYRLFTTQSVQHNADLFFSRVLLAGRSADVLDGPIGGCLAPMLCTTLSQSFRHGRTHV